MITQDTYRQFPAVANSDLTWYAYKMMDKKHVIDCEQAFKMGTLIDCMITEPHKVDYFKYRVEDVQYLKSEFDLCKRMKASFMQDRFCLDMIKDCHFQHISYQPEFIVEHEGVKFMIPAKAKWDLKKKLFPFGGDIKSTTATTYEQCLAAVDYFNYDRSRAWYMDLEGHQMDYLIFISKGNFKVFIIPVCSIDYGAKATPGQAAAYNIYRNGKAKYQKLAFDYTKMFLDLKIA